MILLLAPGKARPIALTAAALVTILAPVLLSADNELRPDYRPAAHALVGGRVVAAPGTVFDPGTVLVRNGIIEAVGKSSDVPVPADAETIDAKGMVVYPGFIDLYTNVGVPAGVSRTKTGPGRNVAYADFALPSTPPDNRNGITPEFEVAAALELSDATADERRKLGFTDLLAAPGGPIAAGQSALVSLGGLTRRESIVKSPVGLHVQLVSPAGVMFGESRECIDEIIGLDDHKAAAPTPEEQQDARRRAARSATYPVSLMGVVAHLRQAMLDSDYEYELRGYHAKNGGPRPSFDPALDALHAAKSKSFPTFYEANTRDEIHRALDLSAEFGTSPIIVGGRDAARVADRLKAQKVPVVLRIDLADEPKVPTEAEYRKRDAEGRDVALKVLADRASRWKERAGTAAALRKAGVTFALASDGLTKLDTFPAQVRKLIAAGLTADAAVEALTKSAAEIAGVDRTLGTIEKGKLGHLVVMTAALGDEKAKPRYVLIDGTKFDLDKSTVATKKADSKSKSEAKAKDKEKADLTSPPKGEEDQPTKHEAARTKAEKAVAPKAEATPAKAEAPVEKAKAVAEPPKAVPRTADDQGPTAAFSDVSSETDGDRLPKLRTGGDVLIKNATLLTGTKEGTIAKGSILVRKGKIVAVGVDLVAPADVAVIDATGLVAMPGIIDTHSHMAIQGGVNEMTLSIVPEVRVADVVDGDDPTIYRALAGGTTMARLLHGSANSIGGQDVVIKLRYGLAGRDLILKDDSRPQGVKFALGENVTGFRGRFPNTRMGVEATIERAFLEGRAYGTALKAREKATAAGEEAPPFRRDLRLEALAGIVDGSIKIHSHCYRSDEILMLMALAERFGIRVQSLQHVLEGYKVAPEIAAHGASASTFSDWWAYKVEAFDAIPFNAALLTDAGVSVCIKSDSEELVRHLYLEASKMVRYGGVSEAPGARDDHPEPRTRAGYRPPRRYAGSG